MRVSFDLEERLTVRSRISQKEGFVRAQLWVDILCPVLMSQLSIFDLKLDLRTELKLNLFIESLGC